MAPLLSSHPVEAERGTVAGRVLLEGMPVHERVSMCTGLLPQCDNAPRSVATRSPWKFDVFQTEDNRPGCSQQGSSFNVRLLDFVASRPAKVGDKLVTTKFKNSLTGGFAAVEEPTVAVCFLPGTEVAFAQKVECEHVFNVVWSQKLISAKVARFRRINLEQPRVTRWSSPMVRS